MYDVKNLQEILDKKLDISVCVGYNRSEDELYVEFETTNSYNEDVIFTSVIENSDNIKKIIKNIIEDFNYQCNDEDDFINEYVDTYNEYRGKNGVPEKVTDLINAAKENYESLKNIIKQLEEILYKECV